MATGLTPQQLTSLQSNVNKLLNNLANTVKVPTTKGTFYNTPTGWVNTTAGNWDPNPKLENYPIFSAKWGPVNHIFTRLGETEDTKKQTTHLYLYFGVDRLFSRNISNFSDMSHGMNMFRMSSICPSYIIFVDSGWTTNPSNWAVPLTPELFEVNNLLTENLFDNLGYITPPNANAAYYTGWVETPWKKSDTSNAGYEMFAAFWKSYDSTSNRPLLTLVLYRGPYLNYPYLNTSVGDNMPMVETIANDNMTTLSQHNLYLTEIVSEPFTIFDEIETIDGEVGIAQGQTGALNLDTETLNPPALALRGHLFSHVNPNYTCLMPSITLPYDNLRYELINGKQWLTYNNLKYKGNYVFIRGVGLSDIDNDKIRKGQFDWRSTILSDYEYAKIATETNVYGNTDVIVYLPECAAIDPVGTTAQGAAGDRQFSFYARILLDKNVNLFFLLFWCAHPLVTHSSEPEVPTDCVVAENWFDWCQLQQVYYLSLDNKYIGKSYLFKASDSVVGRLEFSDLNPDADWSIELRDPDKYCCSIDYNYELSGPGEGTSRWTRTTQLYGFSDPEYTTSSLASCDIVVRQHLDDDGLYINYCPLSSLSSIPPDGVVVPDNLRSLSVIALSDNVMLEIYDFEKDELADELTSQPGKYDLILRHRDIDANNLRQVEYIELSNLTDEMVKVDSEANVNRQSLEKKHDAANMPYLQWWKFDDIHYTTHLSDLVEGCADFAIRQEDGGNGIHVNYVPWEELSVKVDTQGPTSKSIEKDSSTSELRLYDFLGDGCTYKLANQYPTFWNIHDDNMDVLLRDKNTHTLKYYDLRHLSRYPDGVIGDSPTRSLQMDVVGDLDRVAFQLWDFELPTVLNKNFTIKYDNKPYHITNGLSSVEDRQMLVRDGTGDAKELEYWDFTITAPKVGTGDITNELYLLIIQGGGCDCAEKWVWLSGYLDNLSGEYWVQGGDNTNCYGSSIGDSALTKAIDLDNHLLMNGWQVLGSLDVNDLGTFNDGIDVTGCAYFNDGVYIDNGTATITNGCIQFSSTQAMFYDGIGVDGAASIGSGCIWFSGTPVAFYDGIAIGSGKTLQIGSTTLSEAQLQQLLRLI